MAKKSKEAQSNITEVTNVLENEIDGALISAQQEIQEVTTKVAEQVPQERMWLIQHAASHMIQGYKDTWWSSIKAYAEHMRLGENALESQCKKLFLQWGAKLK